MAKAYKREVVLQMCRTKLEINFRDAKELNGWLEEDGVKLTRVTIPHGRGELAKGTLSSIIRQLGADRALFDGLVQCPASRADLVARHVPPAEETEPAS